MRRIIKNILYRLLPEGLYLYLKNKHIDYKNKKHHGKVKNTSLPILNFTLTIPTNHNFIKYQREQPRRNRDLGVVARYAGRKYPTKPIVDIGANIGDTAAIIASECSNDLILVDGSDFYFSYLEKNALLFPNKCTLHHCLVADGSEQTGSLVHWGGTAFFEPTSNGTTQITKTLTDIADNACLIKIDTDGFDYQIINGNLEALSRMQPVIMFENQIRKLDDVKECRKVYDNLEKLDYKFYCLFDDQGYLILSTNDTKHLEQANLFMHAQFADKLRKKSVSNYNVFCFHNNDNDLFQSVVEEYKTLMENA